MANRFVVLLGACFMEILFVSENSQKKLGEIINLGCLTW